MRRITLQDLEYGEKNSNTFLSFLAMILVLQSVILIFHVFQCLAIFYVLLCVFLIFQDFQFSQPFFFCFQESSEIACFHFFSFLLRDPKQEMTAFLKYIFSLSCLNSTSLSPSSGNTAREERGGTVTLRAIFKPLMKAASLVKVFESRVK